MSSKSASILSSAKPRASASLIIINAQNEVLLVQRNPKAESFAGAHVFPGGNYDPKQDDALSITALRETFEETGLLVASSTESTLPSDSELDLAREAIHSQKLLFKDFLKEHQMSMNVSTLLPFTQWVTPVTQPKRFHTQFYVTFLNSALSTGFTSGQKQDRLPTPDGGQEVISARFVHPQIAIDEFDSQQTSLFPPQYYLLFTLAGLLPGSHNTAGQRAKIQQLSAGLFGQMIINPRALPSGPDTQGRSTLTYEGDETRGGSPGRRHRVTLKLGKGGLPLEVQLQRNFDIFTEIEAHAFTHPAKL